MMSQRILWLSLLILLVCACGARPRATGAPLATTTPTFSIPHQPGVADLWHNPPPAGELVEVDAYFSGATGFPLFGGSRPPLPNQVACPAVWNSALTDQPFLSALRLGGSAHSNTLADDAAWLIATIPEATEPGKRVGGEFPYHARFRGRLGEPAFADCPHAERIFVVEEVVIIVEEQPQEKSANELELPAGYETWPRYHDAALDYSVPYPPYLPVDAFSETELLSAVALRAPQWPDYPVMVRVHEGETIDGQYSPSSIAALLEQANGGGIFQQGGTFEAISQTQQLSGYSLHFTPVTNKNKAAILFNAHGRTYELSLDYPLGFEASQSLLTHFSAIVTGFQLDVPPPSSPIPPPPASEPTEMPNADSSLDSGEVEVIDVSVSYGEVLPDAKAETSDLIVFGVVTALSGTKFNSDDGKRYESSSDLLLPIHTVTLSVNSVLKGEPHVPDKIDITVIGNSPTDEEIGSHAEHNIQVGENIIVYLNETSLIWKDGSTRPKFMFITSPKSSYKVQLEDGLFYSEDEHEMPKTIEEIMADVR